MLTFKHHSHHKRLRSEVRKENFYRNYSSFDSETSRKSYARALMESSDDGRDKKNNVHSDDSSCKRSSTTAHSMKAPLRKAFENGETVIITRRRFHDDWSRIMFTLKKQTEIEFSYESFHANKAILTLSEDNANLLFKIRVQMDGQQWETTKSNLSDGTPKNMLAKLLFQATEVGCVSKESPSIYGIMIHLLTLEKLAEAFWLWQRKQWKRRTSSKQKLK